MICCKICIWWYCFSYNYVFLFKLVGLLHVPLFHVLQPPNKAQKKSAQNGRKGAKKLKWVACMLASIHLSSHSCSLTYIHHKFKGIKNTLITQQTHYCHQYSIQKLYNFSEVSETSVKWVKLQMLHWMEESCCLRKRNTLANKTTMKSLFSIILLFFLLLLDKYENV